MPAPVRPTATPSFLFARLRQDARNRLASVAAGGITQATYVYDANEQLAIRDSIAAPVGVTHYIHDIFGNPGLRRGRLNRRNRRWRRDRRHWHRARVHLAV